MAVILLDLLDEKQVTLELKARKKEDALREIVHLLHRNGRVAEPEKFLDAILARERTTPTLAENGVAFPHARTELVKEIILGIGRSSKGVSFGKSGDRARLIFVIGVPQQMVHEYLVCVGALARLVKDEAIRSALLSAKTPTALVEKLRGAALLL